MDIDEGNAQVDDPYLGVRYYGGAANALGASTLFNDSVKFLKKIIPPSIGQTQKKKYDGILTESDISEYSMTKYLIQEKPETKRQGIMLIVSREQSAEELLNYINMLNIVSVNNKQMPSAVDNDMKEYFSNKANLIQIYIQAVSIYKNYLVMAAEGDIVTNFNNEDILLTSGITFTIANISPKALLAQNSKRQAAVSYYKQRAYKILATKQSVSFSCPYYGILGNTDKSSSKDFYSPLLIAVRYDPKIQAIHKAEMDPLINGIKNSKALEIHSKMYVNKVVSLIPRLKTFYEELTTMQGDLGQDGLKSYINNTLGRTMYDTGLSAEDLAAVQQKITQEISRLNVAVLGRDRYSWKWPSYKIGSLDFVQDINICFLNIDDLFQQFTLPGKHVGNVRRIAVRSFQTSLQTRNKNYGDQTVLNPSPNNDYSTSLPVLPFTVTTQWLYHRSVDTSILDRIKVGGNSMRQISTFALTAKNINDNDPPGLSYVSFSAKQRRKLAYIFAQEQITLQTYQQSKYFLPLLFFQIIQFDSRKMRATFRDMYLMMQGTEYNVNQYSIKYQKYFELNGGPQKTYDKLMESLRQIMTYYTYQVNSYNKDRAPISQQSKNDYYQLHPKLFETRNRKKMYKNLDGVFKYISKIHNGGLFLNAAKTFVTEKNIAQRNALQLTLGDSFDTEHWVGHTLCLMVHLAVFPILETFKTLSDTLAQRNAQVDPITGYPRNFAIATFIEDLSAISKEEMLNISSLAIKSAASIVQKLQVAVGQPYIQQMSDYFSSEPNVKILSLTNPFSYRNQQPAARYLQPIFLGLGLELLETTSMLSMHYASGLQKGISDKNYRNLVMLFSSFSLAFFDHILNAFDVDVQRSSFYVFFSAWMIQIRQHIRQPRVANSKKGRRIKENTMGVTEIDDLYTVNLQNEPQVRGGMLRGGQDVAQLADLRVQTNQRFAYYK